ncbi:hypothetical protein MNEG_6990 [Monoraphidium neglectum]|uniref:Symplekin/Pta1 N-terminal domain-containing protein n=1 Tax=Monoraphidium neglectum TaxID=145388 RepID=A0A0D2MCK4_9CHLO|nr:hypothetical protein MNEG_6990 [Monoraphidium neglectum]KIZ00970.1 hypothetical protein MNEG_6990 [Monoraphidium neglectum]|eukprot:XP_013899989.1 hypothetical protein MNEG_6990 [Monoraphidium neglectum]
MSVVEDVVRVLNNAKLSSEPASKLAQLQRLRELLLQREPQLLDTFIDELALFQVDPHPSVRRWLADFAGAAAAARPSLPVLTGAAQALGGLAADDNASVLQLAAVACHPVLRLSLAMHAAQLAGADADSTWAAALDLLARATKLAGGAPPGAAGPHASGAAPGSVAARLAGIKLCESSALLLTSELAPLVVPVPGQYGPPMRTLPDAPAITQAAREAVAKLAELVAAPSAPQLPGPVLIGAVGALASLAQRRAALLQPALVPLLALASKGDVRAPSPGDGQDGVAASKGAALRAALARLLRLPADHLAPWRAQISQALAAMGAGAAADSAQRQLARLGACGQASSRASGARQRDASGLARLHSEGHEPRGPACLALSCVIQS